MPLFDDADLEQDPLIDIANRYPEAAARFLKVVMLVGALSAFLVSIPCGIFLSRNWAACQLCSRPLHIWLLVYCMLQLLQAPLRLVFFRRLYRLDWRQDAMSSSREVQECCERLILSCAWQASKLVSIFTYAWFVLGIVWLLNSSSCSPCPGLFSMSMYVILWAVARICFSTALYRYCFADLPATMEAILPQGASQELVEKLPLIKYSPWQPERGRGESGCAICLCAFEAEEQLRRLPCGHRFHRDCIDTWLQRSRKCPLCLGDVGELPRPGHQCGFGQAKED